MHDGGEVAILAEDLFEEPVARDPLGVEDGLHAAAGVDEEAKNQGEVGLMREIADSLTLAVFFEAKIVLRKVLDDSAIPVADGGDEVDDLNVTGERHLLREATWGHEESENSHADIYAADRLEVADLSDGRLSDVKLSGPGRLGLNDLKAADVAAARSLPQAALEIGELLFRACGAGFHATVVQIPDPAGDTGLARRTLGIIPESDALDASRNQISPPFETFHFQLVYRV
jgi:hypothetical protein